MISQLQRLRPLKLLKFENAFEKEACFMDVLYA